MAASGPRSTANPWTAEAERLEARKLGEALARTGVPALFVRWPDRRGSPDGLPLRGLSLGRPGLPAAHRNLHPNPGVLDQHARHLSQQLRQSGVLTEDGRLRPERAPDFGP